MYKARLIIILIACAMHANAQTIPADTSRIAAITPIEKPFGEIASKKIDNKGGTVTSADGKLKVIFPAGALDTATTISIQSTSNGLTANNTGAYYLQPSGINFKKPVEVIFFYTGDNDDQQSIATQDKTGRWWMLKKTKLDTINKNISGFVPHFSTWALFEKLILLPQKATIKTGASIRLTVYEYSQDEELLEELKKSNDKNYSSDAELLTPLVQVPAVSIDGPDLPPLVKNSDTELPPLKPNYKISRWTVNDIENGNNQTGTIISTLKLSAVYKAPSEIPEQNPVAVTAKVEGISYKMGIKKSRTLYLTSNIKITGNGYRFTFIHKNMAGCFHYVDSSSCIVQLDGNTASLSEITNHKPWSDWDPCTKCSNEYTNKATYKANVEIWGMAGSKVTAATKEKPMTDVYITLAPAFGNTPAQWVHCPKNPRVEIPSFALPADPKYIHFETNGNDIIVHYMGLSGKNIISKKVKNEETIIKVEKL